MASIDQGFAWAGNGLFVIQGYQLQARFLNFYRQDDYCARVYLYLDRPARDLPPLPSLETRIKRIEQPEPASWPSGTTKRLRTLRLPPPCRAVTSRVEL